MEYGLLGEKLSHSYSKEIHSFLGEYDYSLCEVRPENVGDFMKGRDFSGLNVTIPYKETVIEFLDAVSEEAKKVGAVNTVKNENGFLSGYNTDLAAMKKALERSGISLSGKKVLIFGSGGTAKTARAVCAEMNAGEVITVSRRKSEDTVTYSEAYSFHSDAQIIINTTPCGMYPDTDDIPADISPFLLLEGVFDVIYNPIRTNLIQSAQERGIKTADGLYMLVHQAVLSSEIFTGEKYQSGKSDEIYRKVLSQKKNIVLIGMPSCGKTSVGKILSADTGMRHIDTDNLITEKTGMEIKDIFGKYGENGFRDIETQVIREVSSVTGSVISVGGGSILREENVRLLKQNSILIFLDRDLSLLCATNDRPLSSTAQDLGIIYCQRRGIYEKVADDIIKADDFITAAKEIEERHIL